MKLVAQGEEVQYLGSVERLFQEGESGEVRLYLNRTLSEPELTNLRQDIKAKGGVLVGEIRQVGGIASIRFRKELPFLLLLVPLLAGAGVVGWQVLKPETTGSILLIGAGVALLALLVVSLSESKTSTKRVSYGKRG